MMWEYKIEVMRPGEGLDTKEKVLNEMGIEDWELVAVKGTAEESVFYFKRAKEVD